MHQQSHKHLKRASQHKVLPIDRPDVRWRRSKELRSPSPQHLGLAQEKGINSRATLFNMQVSSANLGRIQGRLPCRSTATHESARSERALLCGNSGAHEQFISCVHVVFGLGAILDHQTRRGSEHLDVFDGIPGHRSIWPRWHAALRMSNGMRLTKNGHRSCQEQDVAATCIHSTLFAVSFSFKYSPGSS